MPRVAKNAITKKPYVKKTKRVYKKTSITKSVGSLPQKYHIFGRMTGAQLFSVFGGVIRCDDQNFNAPSGIVKLANQYAEIPNNLSICGAMLFRLTDVIQVSDYNTLFDSYKILGVEMQWDYLSANNPNVSLGGISIPELYYARDMDDVIVPANLSSLQAYQSCKRVKLEQSRTIKQICYPQPALQMYKTSGTTTGYGHLSGKNKLWIDLTYNDVEHYAYKFVLANICSQADVAYIRLQLRYIIEFKDPR